MNVFHTAMRALSDIWPFYVFVAGVLAVAELFSMSGAGLSAAFLCYSFLVATTHHSILAGGVLMKKAKNTPASKDPKIYTLRFFGVIFLLVWAPMLIASVVGARLLPDPSAFGGLLLSAFSSAVLWISLSFFGTRIPNTVWEDMGHPVVDGAKKKAPIVVFTAMRLLLWNGSYALVAVGILLLFWEVLSALRGLPVAYFDAGFEFIRGCLSGVAIALTAAVLSHAHVRAYDLGPQGFILKP
ncbi:MAG: hypothetical protein AAFO58_07035 [Pseudomonadota bacterium]